MYITTMKTYDRLPIELNSFAKQILKKYEKQTFPYSCQIICVAWSSVLQAAKARRCTSRADVWAAVPVPVGGEFLLHQGIALFQGIEVSAAKPPSIVRRSEPGANHLLVKEPGRNRIHVATDS